LICFHCSQEFQDGVFLKKHHLVEHPDKPYVCTNCEQEFSDKNTYLKHRYDKHKKPFACNVCVYRAQDIRMIKSHVRTKHKEKIHDNSIGYHRTRSIDKPSCFHCNQEFNDIKSFCNHHTAEHPEEPFVCEHCEKQFERRAYVRHRGAYHIRRDWACNTCDYKGAPLTTMKIHVEKHFIEEGKGQNIKDKPFACNKCEYKSSKSRDLRLHVDSGSCGKRKYAKAPVRDVVKVTTKENETENCKEVIENNNETEGKGADEEADMRNCDQENIMPNEQRPSKGKISEASVDFYKKLLN
jgi:KRAB domain-containing zinc finger protein